MPRKKNKEEVIEEVAEEVEVAPEVVETPKVKEVVYPEVGSHKKFQVIQFGEGYLVYNPAGQRVSNVIRKEDADDLVLRMNSKQGLK